MKSNRKICIYQRIPTSGRLDVWEPYRPAISAPRNARAMKMARAMKNGAAMVAEIRRLTNERA
jgi:hypothetical protein